MSKRKPYPTDLKDNEWKVIANYFPNNKKTGRPKEHSNRELVNAMMYLLRSGCSWRMLPHDFPKWQTVYHYFNLWSNENLFEEINSKLRADLRELEGREELSSAGIIDSQSVKTVDLPGEKGYDAGKKNKGSKASFISRLFGVGN